MEEYGLKIYVPEEFQSRESISLTYNRKYVNNITEYQFIIGYLSMKCRISLGYCTLEN